MEDDQSIPEKPPNLSEFKKPVLFGRIGKLPKKVPAEPDKHAVETPLDKNINSRSDQEKSNKSILPPAVLPNDILTNVPYKEPKWSGISPDGADYALEVLKSGLIVDKVDLVDKPYLIFGRLANCDVIMAHPTISRHHAVLQYKATAEEDEPKPGWYLYDLGSTHGTYLNKEKLKPNHYTRVRVGHQIKFGNSTRVYIVLGPDFDAEGESELTVTEIRKQAQLMKLERDRMILEAKEQKERERIEEEKKIEEQGIDWGMGEDAEDEADLSENPYAVTTNEELYLDDPKKTLRGYFEREGLEMSYHCEERGIGQFVCRVELPMDDPRGRPIVAEVIHKGKKKEAVIACALEACRILDRAGLLRQAKHESKKRKERDWSADDYYDSDEDTFLDRTGSVERKRHQRMQKHGAIEKEKDNKPLTYDDLLNQISEIESRIEADEKHLEVVRGRRESAQQTSTEDDELDQYMSTLGRGHTMQDKAEISKTKMSIQKLKMELSKTQRLADIARPAHLPPLIKKGDAKVAVKVAGSSVVYGKRIKLKEDIDKRSKPRPELKTPKQGDDEEFVEEMDSDEENEKDEESIDQETLKDELPSSNKSDIDIKMKSNPKIEDSSKDLLTKDKKVKDAPKKIFGPMRPPENYVIPESYYEQESDRDLPEIVEKE